MVRWLFKFLAYLAATLLLIILLAYATGYGYLVRGVRFSYLRGYTSANIYDGKDFDTRTVPNGSAIAALPKSAVYNQLKMPKALEAMLERTRSTSFLVLRNDSMVWEYYYRKHTDSTPSNSFSMAKTITTILVQCAIEEGRIKSWDARVKDYLPWISGPFADKLTLRHLSQMTAGLDWSESYVNPLGITARAYYGNDVEETMKHVSVIREPGISYHYQSGATQLLGLCLKKAIQKPIATYASEKLWVPIGAETDASWHTDKPNGMELTYCCFNAITRDFARIGRMIEHHGKTNTTKIVDSAFLEYAVKPNKVAWYGQSFWLGETHGKPFHQLQGTMGQFIIIIPEYHMVIVRTGHQYLHSKNGIPECAQVYADETVNAFFK